MCIFYNLDKNDKLEIMVGVTVDDCVVTGLPLNIKWFMKGLEGRFEITTSKQKKIEIFVETQYSVIHFTLGLIQIDDVTAHIWHRHDSAPCAIRILTLPLFCQ